jgi:hypothetical protein
LAFVTIPGLQRTTSLRYVLRYARETSSYPTFSPTKSVNSFRVISGANQMKSGASIRKDSASSGSPAAMEYAVAIQPMIIGAGEAAAKPKVKEAPTAVPRQLQNTDNIIILPTLLHEAVSDEYLKRSLDPNMNLYQWLQTRPYDVQREEGLRILRDLHILK